MGEAAASKCSLQPQIPNGKAALQTNLSAVLIRITSPATPHVPEFRFRTFASE